MNEVTQQTTYKHNLQGITLPSGWKITQQLPRAEDATGGNFGVGYIATRNGETAFVKAIDFVRAMSSNDPAQALADTLRFGGCQSLALVKRRLPSFSPPCLV